LDKIVNDFKGWSNHVERPLGEQCTV